MKKLTEADIIKKRGVIEKLEEMGIKEGDTVKFGDIEFDFVY